MFAMCELRLTAEFGIEEDGISAMAGDQTALWQMFADQPHPVMGEDFFVFTTPLSF